MISAAPLHHHERMRRPSSRSLVAAAIASLLCLPAVALAKPALPGPDAPLPAKAKAYGRYCQEQSKKHVEGEKGTAFSQCVTAMAKLAKGKAASPKEACKELSKQHVAGEKGTPFSRCVKGAKRLLEDVATS
jgi:hypothetical protein